MMGFKEDLINLVVREISQTWEKKKGNLTYFVNLVEKTPLTPKDLDEWLTEHGDTCHEGVNNVFACIVYDDFMNNQKGGQK